MPSDIPPASAGSSHSSRQWNLGHYETVAGGDGGSQRNSKPLYRRSEVGPMTWRESLESNAGSGDCASGQKCRGLRIIRLASAPAPTSSVMSTRSALVKPAAHVEHCAHTFQKQRAFFGGIWAAASKTA